MVADSLKEPRNSHFEVRNKTMRRSILAISLTSVAALVGACSTETKVPAPAQTPTPAATSSPSVKPSVSPTASDADSKKSALEGRWAGDKGDYLIVAKKDDKYTISIKKGTSAAESFEGTVKDDSIEFKRNNKVETISLGKLEDTGLKTVTGDKTCIVVTKGSEGYCKE